MTDAPMNARIAAINTKDVHKITSGQVIVDLTSAVKELVDNSIDAGADQIELIFKNYGMESFECIDNGAGISEENYASIALKHYTSKISNYQDVSRVTTLGFRGEALSSLSAIANIVVITTTNPPKAAKLEFDFGGNLVKNTVTSRNKGTTVQVSHLFNSLPVRKKEFTKNHKRIFNKCITLLQAYTIIQDNIKISVWHATSNGRKSLVLSSTKSQGLPKRILSVFGSSGMKGLSEINMDLDLNSSKPRISKMYAEEPYWESLDYRIQLTGYISKNSFGCGRNAKDRQFVYINKRPVEHPQLLKCCNEVYRTFNNVQYPALFLNFEIAPELLDINITPDKRTVLLHNEDLVLDVLREKLGEFYSSQEMVLPLAASLKSNDSENSVSKRRKLESTSSEISSTYGDDDDDHNRDAIYRTPLERIDEGARGLINNKKNDTRLDEKNSRDDRDTTGLSHDEMDMAGVKVTMISPNGHETNVQRTLDSFAHPTTNTATLFVNDSGEEEEEEIVTVEVGDKKLEEKAVLTKDNDLIFSQENANESSCACHSDHNHDLDLELNDENDDAITLENEQQHVEEDEEIEEDIEEGIVAQQGEINVRVSMPNSVPTSRNSLKGGDSTAPQLQSTRVSLALEIDHLNTSFRHALTFCGKMGQDGHETKIQKNEQIENFDEGEKYLTLTVSKADFKEMTIIGQFNLGFILATRRLNHKFDLFILDQHASDEKFNFEMLQKSTTFKSQRLIAPQPIEMSIIDELIVMDNLAVFERNGFKLEVDENQPQGSRVKLISLPVSKRTIFDSSDLNELIHLVKETDGLNKMNVRCSKIRAMFAMRACRSSIMVGKPLTRKAMTRVVRHLSELDKPWNCPHGRPTMRHLMELRDWDSFKSDYEL